MLPEMGSLWPLFLLKILVSLWCCLPSVQVALTGVSCILGFVMGFVMGSLSLCWKMFSFQPLLLSDVFAGNRILA